MKSKASSVTLIAFIATVIFAWGASLFLDQGPKASVPWAVYDQSLYLTGLLSIALMSLTMILATRPAWLEPLFGGLDRIYRAHKWAGILAVAFAAVHWLIEMGDDLIKSVFGRGGRLSEPDFSGFVEMMRDTAEDIGEWAIYLAIAMLLLTLWRTFPYKFWRYLHRVMPVLYLLLVFHALWLAPIQWWSQPVGLLMALLLVGGCMASLLSVSGRIGRRRQARGTIASVHTPAPDIAEVVCRLDRGWKGHRPGQFAFVTFERLEGAHPFTIASADHGDGLVTFQIKALGDYTRDLARKLTVGQSIKIEGPYGRFDFRRSKPGAHQIWVAAGIGVTPFLAWLEALTDDPGQAPSADLHYCTRDAAADPSATRLRKLCAALPNIRLQIHDSSQGDALTADQLVSAPSKRCGVDLWFCGPTGLAQSLQRGLRKVSRVRLRFHQEAFQLR
jgi:predicted ferric reductase